MNSYPWYKIVVGTDQLLQGDIIISCPVIIPSLEVEEEEIKNIDAQVNKYDVVIMSQSCDIVQKKLNLVLVCPVLPMHELEKNSEFMINNKVKEKIRQGTVPGYHLLNNPDLDGLTDFLVVDFRNVYGVQLEFLIGLAKKREKRLRLLPPYREHLSQAFARFFMRVGLPVDIPSFIDK